ncbi:MAG TPA: PTS sugar transporter subunit IIA [Chlamydiales bacterium]|jgi:PTS system nitrogen regulatory IIA component|nr:PTS sugar transporter subunit IIA [Chlamydiales bacterium]
MDLKLKDVAELLNVSEATIRRWISDGKIPYYRLSQQYRFSRSEIENWVLSCKQGKGEFSPFNQEEVDGGKERLGTHQFGLYRAIHKGGVYKDIPGGTKEEVIRNAMNEIARDLHLDAEVITELLLDREKLMPTALSNGIGVPHTRDFLLQESFDVVVVVFPKEPIEYGALDGQSVHTLFFLFACDDKRHLHLLAKLAHLCSRPENLSYLQTRPPKQQLLETIKHWEANVKMKGSRETALV